MPGSPVLMVCRAPRRVVGNAIALEGRIEVVCLTQKDEIGKLVQLFADVAQEQGWQPEEALDAWAQRSQYFALHIKEKGLSFLGGLQLVLPDGQGRVPSHAVWPEVPTQTRSAHVAILALEASHRGQTLLFWRLTIEMWRYCVGQGITTLFIEVTPRVLPLYRRLGWPLQIVGEKRMHWGEECYLCTLGIPDVARTLLQKAETSPYYHEIIAQAFRVTLAAGEESNELVPLAA